MTQTTQAVNMFPPTKEIQSVASCRLIHIKALLGSNASRYIHGQHSRDKLKTTRTSLTQIMTYHQVMPAYVDFVFLFGSQNDANDLRFSGFRERIQLKTHPTCLSIPTLGRSGRHYQLCYNLKSIHQKNESNVNVTLDEWSIRQVAIYHQFDVEHGTTLWIVTKGGTDLLDRYEEMTGPKGRLEDKQFNTPGHAFRSSLSTHLLFCHWSTEDWRYYLRWLERVLDHQVSVCSRVQTMGCN
jgi:hypothetical protein